MAEGGPGHDGGSGVNVNIWDCMDGTWALRAFDPTPEQSAILRASGANFESHPQQMSLTGWTDYCETITGTKEQMLAVDAKLKEVAQPE